MAIVAASNPLGASRGRSQGPGWHRVRSCTPRRKETVAGEIDVPLRPLRPAIVANSSD